MCDISALYYKNKALMSHIYKESPILELPMTFRTQAFEESH